MEFGGLEKILKRSAMFLVGSSLAFNLLTGCGKEESPVAPENQAPETTMISGPSGTIEENTATFEWGGNDPDGNVDHYEYKLSPTMDIYAEIYGTTKTFTDLSNDNYIFYVKAVDNKDMEDPTPAERNFIVSKEYTIVLQPSQEGIDADVFGEWQNGEPTEACDINSGNGIFLTIGVSDYATFLQIFRSYLKFNLDIIPQNADILNATLSLYKEATGGPNYQVLVQANRVINNWNENSITWNNQPGFSDVVEYTNINIFTNDSGWYDFLITNLVSGWINNEYDNYGLVLKLSNEDFVGGYGGFGSNFWSSDYEIIPSKKPKLEITYK